MSLFRSFFKQHKVDIFFLLLLLVLGSIYISQAWSPSSYGHVLNKIGVADNGVVWGHPRAIRSDEWSVTTPLTQAAVRNNFNPINNTSYYQESLRINYGLPLHDWGIIFKPSMWLYGLVDPAYAYSFYYWFNLCAFIIGYALLFRKCGIEPLDSYLVSTGIFFTGFVQFFWNSNATLLSYFPFLILLASSRINYSLKFILFTWSGATWLIGNFYPPIFISCFLISLFILLAYDSDSFRWSNIAVVLTASLLACTISVTYLWEYLQATINTSYPGQRTSVSGYYPLHLFLTQFWPTALFNQNYDPAVTYTNITGIGVIGQLWFFFLPFLLAWNKSTVFTLSKDKPFLFLLSGYLITVAWMMFPVPEILAKISLLNRVPPERMIFASGLLLCAIALHLYKSVGLHPGAGQLRISVSIFFYCTVIYLYFLFFPSKSPQDFIRLDIALIVLTISFYLLASRFTSKLTALLFASLISNLYAFGRFNPVQSAIPIFEQRHTLFHQTLDKHINSDGVLTVQHPEFIGATLNGMGYRAVAHLNAYPQWDLWSERALSEEDHRLLNRYAHIRLHSSPSIFLLENDQVGLPSHWFRTPPSLTVNSSVPDSASDALSQWGQFKLVSLDLTPFQADLHFFIDGFLAEEVRFMLINREADHPLASVHVSDMENWSDVFRIQNPTNLLNGFRLLIDFKEGSGDLQLPCLFIRHRHSDWLLLPYHHSVDKVQKC